MLESIELEENTLDSLTFEHPLTMKEKERVIYYLLGNKSLKQIYFVDDVDVDTIMLVKYMLEFSSDLVDADIEKAILKRDSSSIVDDVLEMFYQNPNSWYVSFKNNGISYDVVDIPRYRIMNSYIMEVIDEVRKKSSSALESILLIYDVVKLFNYNKEDKYSNISNIIESGNANSKGFNFLFSVLLNKMGIKSFVGEIVNEDEIFYITLVNVIDDKYGIDGMYLFSALDDNVNSEKNSEDLRKINYNFFGLPINCFEHHIGNLRLSNVLSCLSIEDFKFSDERRRLLIKNDNGINQKALEEAIGCDYKSIHKRCHLVKQVEIDMILSVIKNVYLYDEEMLLKIKDNYQERQNEIFFE